MRLLIGSRTPDRMFHWNELSKRLTDLGVECQVVNNTDIIDGFPTKKIHKWIQSSTRFNHLIDDFKPDVILTDGLRHFGLAALRTGIPLIVNLAGDFWSEIQLAKETSHRSFPRNQVIGKLERMGEKILRESRAIMPISNYLDQVVHEHFPDKPTHVLGTIIDPSVWYPENGMSLDHPCVGLVQKATIWGKAKEMLVLRDVLEQLPNVTFYWAGDGPFTNVILDELKMYPNFKPLGSLDYPDGVRQFLTEIDVYALLTGLDMAPISLQEALLMRKPTVATNVGGIPEIMNDSKSGLLVDVDDADGLAKKILYLLNNPLAAKQMGMYGKKVVAKNAAWERITKEFCRYMQKELDFNI